MYFWKFGQIKIFNKKWQKKKCTMGNNFSVFRWDVKKVSVGVCVDCESQSLVQHITASVSFKKTTAWRSHTTFLPTLQQHVLNFPNMSQRCERVRLWETWEMLCFWCQLTVRVFQRSDKLIMKCFNCNDLSAPIALRFALPHISLVCPSWIHVSPVFCQSCSLYLCPTLTRLLPRECSPLKLILNLTSNKQSCIWFGHLVWFVWCCISPLVCQTEIWSWFICSAGCVKLITAGHQHTFALSGAFTVYSILHHNKTH